MSQGPGPILRAWYTFRMTRFPWRKKRLVGYDLQGNTFWEFKDQLHALRMRRVAKYSRSTHLGDVKVSPSWMQWLRHTRFDPPTLDEQRQDVARQERMKVLALQADQRWAAKPSALDAPDLQQPIQPLQSHDPASGVAQMSASEGKEDRAGPIRQIEEREARPPPVAEEPSPQEMPRDPPVPAPTDAAPAQSKTKARKDPKENPWNQAEPSKDWQPQGWSPAPARRRG